MTKICSKSAKSVQRHQNAAIDVVSVLLLLTLNRFHTLFSSVSTLGFHFEQWSKYENIWVTSSYIVTFGS